MKSFISALIIIFTTTFSYSQLEIHQNGTIANSPLLIDTTFNSQDSNFILYTILYLVNTSDSILEIDFSRTTLEHNPAWGQSISDNVDCWDIPDDYYWERPTNPSAFNQLYIEPGDSSVFVYRTYPNGISDCGIYEINFTSLNGVQLNSIVIRISFNGIDCLSLNVTEEKDDISYKAFPNPAVNNLNIEILNDDIHSIEIYNLMGKMVLIQDLQTGLNQLDVSYLSTGTYIIQVKNSSGLMENRKLIID